jgi:hypothetical protein
MNQSYPVPPPELLDQWCMENNWRDIAIQAAQWGADQELEACCEWLDTEKILTKDGGYIRKLRAARRPKPPSLKEQALAAAYGTRDRRTWLRRHLQHHPPRTGGPR